MCSANRAAGAACFFLLAMISHAACDDGPQPRDAWTTSTFRGRPTAPAPYKVELVYPQLRFERPTSVTEMPATDRLLVTQQGGRIVSFQKNEHTASTSLVGDLSVLAGGDVGINSAAFHPDFQENRFLYVCMVHPDGGRHARVSRFTLTDAAEPKIVPDSEYVIIRWPAGGHGGGCLQFGKEGYLYISTGDGSGPTPPDNRTTGQDITDLLGSVLRIDVDHEAGDKHYTVPPDNPFVNLSRARPEIWSYGLRNPWKFGIDRITGEVFVADNGWETWEMIHKLHRGSNCGWPIMEGRAQLRTEVPCGPTPITPPIKDHPHTEANSVIGGPVYRGNALPDLNATFVYGDYITGTIWGVKLGQDGEFEHRTLVDTDLQIVAFTEGNQGELYVLDYDRTGQLYQLQPSDEVDSSADFPRQLSETGVFDLTDQLVPAAGVLPYSVVAERWMDGAVARRWVALPGRDSIRLDIADPTASAFPDGTVFAKQLTLPADGTQAARRLEMQILHLQDGSWNPYSYFWDEDGQDATLVSSRGADHEISDTTATSRTWHVGSVNECRLCHSAAAGVVLGFTPRQLERVVPTDSGTLHQHKLLADQRVLRQRPTLTGGTRRLVNPHDAAAPIDERARSYLHANCGTCHHRNGPATISFFAHRDYPFDQLRITKPPGIGSFGIQSPRLIAPGDPFRSVILYRISKLGYGRMPYIGSRSVDSRGVALIESWIRSLPRDSEAGAKPVPSGADVVDLLHRLSNSTTDQERNGKIDELLTTTEGALALAATMHRDGIAPASMLHIRGSTERMTGDVRGLFQHFVPGSDRRQTLGANPDSNSVLQLAGDRGRGELIFFSDNGRCRSCHDVRDASKSLGPTLTDIRRKYKRPAELLSHVLQPSLAIEEKFANWTVVGGDGRVHVGLLDSNDEGQVQIRSTDQSVSYMKREEISAMQKNGRSLMPEGALSDLTPQEAADLLAFLLD